MKKHDEIIKAVNESVENSNKMLSVSSMDALRSLRNKMEEVGSKERAQTWYPRAEKIQQLSNDIFDYIENIKQKINDTLINSSEVFEKLKIYREQVLQIDPKITNEFQKSLKVFTQLIDSSRQDQKKLFQDYFKNTSTESTNAMLSKLQNNIKINEMKIITFCNENVGCVDCGIHYVFNAIAVQSSSVVEGGQQLEIIAGMGSFSVMQSPEIFIYGKQVRIHEDGAAHYKLRAASKPGKYFVPVKIKYTDQNGKQQSIQKEIEYTVANIQKQ